MSATARDMAGSPNPDFNRPDREHPDTTRALDYAYHKARSSLGDYYGKYPGDKPWYYGLTPAERAAAYGQQIGGKERERER